MVVKSQIASSVVRLLRQFDLWDAFAMQLPDRLRLPFTFAPELLVRDLQGLNAVAWIKHFVAQNYEGDWSVIPLRGKAGATHPVMMIYSDPSCRDFADTPMLAACPYYRQVLAAFAAPLQAVRLMRLAPGSVIKEHADNDLSFEDGTVRFHIPVVTNPDVEFYLNRERVVLEAGSCWYLRLADPHSVVNGGETDRVHMVIDATVNDWIEGVLKKAAE
jgi:quercetin dioxygenase-like cupin family protein